MAKKKPPITSSRTRSDRSANQGQGNKKNPVSTPKPRTSAVSSMTRQGPTAKGTRTMSNRAQSPRLPKLPKNPTTTYTIRATGGNSTSAKINRLSAQAAPRPKMKAPAKSPMRLGGGGKLGVQAAIIAEALTARNTADGTLTAARKRGDLNRKPTRKKK